MTLAPIRFAFDRKPPALTRSPDAIIFAFDRSPENRWIDEFKRLHIRLTNISKATVNPYRGDEIPDWENLGLEAGKIYQLLRDPEELAKAAKTFDNNPLMQIHVAQTADEPQKMDIVGSLGTDGAFKDPYLQNSMIVWDANAIAGIETGEQREISCCYAYVADMTPGEYKGLRHDGVMRNIRGNHAALVESGRVGSDVLVADSKLENLQMITLTTNSKKALMVGGALSALIRPRLAADAKLDLGGVFQGVNAKNYRAMKPKISERLKKATTGKLAADADLSDVVELLDMMDGAEAGAVDTDMIPEIKNAAGAEDEEDETAMDEDRRDGESDDDYEKRMKEAKDAKAAKDKKAKDAETPEEDKPVTKKAMDAALKQTKTEALTEARANFQAVTVAREAVRPYVGVVDLAMDSADDIYRTALELHGVDIDGVPPAAFPAMLKMVPVPGEARQGNPNQLAKDSAAQADLSRVFPTLRPVAQL